MGLILLAKGTWRPERHPRWPTKTPAGKGGEFMQLNSIAAALGKLPSKSMSLTSLAKGSKRIEIVQVEKKGSGVRLSIAAQRPDERHDYDLDPDGHSMADVVKVLELVDKGEASKVPAYLEAARGKTNKEIHGSDPLNGADDPKANAHHKEILKPKDWVDPPPPRGKLASGAKAGGYSSDAAFGTNTDLGRVGEKAFEKLTEGSILHPPGKGEQSPLDVQVNGFGFEVKAVSVDSTAFKATPKQFEIASKEKAAKELGLKPALAIVVIDSKTGKAKVYWRAGLKGGRLSKNTGWNYMGEVSIAKDANLSLEDIFLAMWWKPNRHPRWPKGSPEGKGGEFMKLLDVFSAADHSISGRVNLDFLRSGANRIKSVRAIREGSDVMVSAKLHNGVTRAFRMNPDDHSMADFMKVLELIDRNAGIPEIQKFLVASHGKTNKEIHGHDPQMGADDPTSAAAATDVPATHEGLHHVEGTNLMVWDDFGDTLSDVGEAGGTTGARWFEDSEGNQWIVKQDEDPLRAQDEFFANAVFARMGLEVPQAVLTKIDGKTVYAAKEVQGEASTASGRRVLDGDYSAQLRKGVLTDMLLAHRDAFGFGPEAPGQNVIVGSHGVTRIDFGGTFDWKGMVGKKDFPQDAVPEFDGMLDPNRSYAKAIQVNMWSTKDIALREQADHMIVTLTDSWLDKAAAQIYANPVNGKHRASALKGRRSYLFERTRPNKVDVHPLEQGALVPTGGPSDPPSGRFRPGQLRPKLWGKTPKALRGYSQQAYEYINPFLRKGELRFGTTRSQQAFNVKLIDEAMDKSWLPNMIRYRSVSRSVLNDLGIDGIEFKAKAAMLSSTHGVPSPQDAGAITELAEQLKGGEFVDDAYMSTAEQIHTTQTFGVINNAAFEVRIPAGTSGVSLNSENLSAHPGERETLLHRGTKLRITGYRLANAGGKTYIILEAEVIEQKQKKV